MGGESDGVVGVGRCFIDGRRVVSCVICGVEREVRSVYKVV